MIVKDYFGSYAEAYDLMMRKEFAYQILRGEKRIEFRSYTDLYLTKFFKKWRWADRKDPEYLVEKDVVCCHFHDRGNTWFMDCSIEGVNIIPIHPNSLQFLHEYGCHDLDETIAKVNKKTKETANCIDWVIVIPIYQLIDTNLDLSSFKPEDRPYTYSIPEGYELPEAKAREMIAALSEGTQRRLLGK